MLLLIDLGEKGHLEKVAPALHGPEGHRAHAGLHAGRADPPWWTRAAPRCLRRGAAVAVAEEALELAAIGLDPVADPVSWTSFARALPGSQREAQDAAHGPARSSPASGRSTATRSCGRPPPRPRLQRAVVARRSAAVPCARRDAPRGGQAPGDHGGRPSRSSTSTGSPATTRSSCRSTAAGRARHVAAGPPSPRSATPTSPCGSPCEARR